MAQITRHPVAPAPAAPPRVATGRMALRAYAILVLFSAFAHTAWWNLLGGGLALVFLGALTVATLAIWIPLIVRGGRRPSGNASGLRVPVLEWRRLPWATMGYVALAALSLLWSRWPGATALTWAGLLVTTLHGLFLAHVLTWRELARALEVALKWVLGLSLLFELWAALVRREPLLPNFSDAPADPDPHWYWTRGALFDPDQRIQGIVGNANVLGILCVLALIVFAVRVAMAPRRRGMLIAWMVLAAVLFARAGSATALIAAAAVAVVLLAALLMRRAATPGARSRLYAVFTGIGVAGVSAVALLWSRILEALGRDSGLTGRDDIWAAVWERAWERPVFGNGFSTPWVPWEPMFDEWILDHGITVFHAHDMWLDVFLQLGVVGLAVVAVVFGAATWRAWFFAVDRPRWDIVADRPYSPLTLLAPLIMALLLTQGLTESGPLMLWGWLLVTAIAFRIKLAPVVGHGTAERADEPGVGTSAERARR
ncbi:O-antigen ligase [Microbacterium sp. Marseille-Q6965]|uniref:O-antigen ligase family protein n=1 Tax=Microbacterium sp. Marseille-Q6965 TaxID=2965072 RepID=UPI0021B7779B|nr:O-antigen ligase family protein [Microbacterium sp. Marseille-Q6965]